MKKTFSLLMLLALFLTSCQTHLKTARTAETEASLRSVAVADLEVADERITYTLVPNDDIRRGGLDNVKQAAEQEALTKHGNADILLDPQYVITKKRSLFGSKVTSVTVSGRPAFYRNFRSLNDSVWANPAFNGVAFERKSKGVFGRTNSNGLYPARKNSKSGKGFECYLTAALMASAFSSSEDCCDGGEGFNINLLSSFGYRFSPYFYLGAGIGIAAETWYDEFVLLPLYLDARLNFSKRPKTFFLDYKLGYTLVDLADVSTPVAFNAIALGYTFGKFDLAFQTTFQSLEQDWCRNYGYYDCGGAEGVLVTYGISFSYKF